MRIVTRIYYGQDKLSHFCYLLLFLNQKYLSTEDTEEGFDLGFSLLFIPRLALIPPSKDYP